AVSHLSGTPRVALVVKAEKDFSGHQGLLVAILGVGNSSEALSCVFHEVRRSWEVLRRSTPVRSRTTGPSCLLKPSYSCLWRLSTLWPNILYRQCRRGD